MPDVPLGRGVLLHRRAPSPGAAGRADPRAEPAGRHPAGREHRGVGVRPAVGGAGDPRLDAVRRRPRARPAGAGHLRRRAAADQLLDGQHGLGADRAVAGAGARASRHRAGAWSRRGPRRSPAAGSTRTTGSGTPPAGWSRRAGSWPAPRADQARQFDVAGEVALHGRPDRRHHRVGRGRGQRFQPQHVARHDQPDELRRDQRGPGGPHVRVESERAHHARAAPGDEELAQQLRRPLVADGGPDQRQPGGLRPGPSHTRSSIRTTAAPSGVAVGREHLGQQVRRVGRGVDRGEEQLVLVAEVVVDQRGVDPGRRRDAADRRAVEPLLGELRPARRPAPPPGCRGCPGAGRSAGRCAARPTGSVPVPRWSVRPPRRVAAARARATRAAPATIAMSNHIVTVASAEEPTSCSASTA